MSFIQSGSGPTFDRREFLRRAGLVGGIAFATPAIITLEASPASATPAPSPTSYAECIQQAKDNYKRDFDANNEALKNGSITAEEWAENQRRIMQEFRQAEQYCRQAYLG